jgi:hypothetical protein
MEPAGQVERERQDETGRTEQSEQGRQNRAGRPGQADPDRQTWTGRTRTDRQAIQAG